MSTMVKVIIKEPRKRPEVKEIDAEDDLKILQRIVGGYIEAVYSPIEGVQIVANEEGKERKDLKPNFSYGYDFIFGTAIFCAYDKSGTMISLSEEQIEEVLHMYNC